MEKGGAKARRSGKGCGCLRLNVKTNHANAGQRALNNSLTSAHRSQSSPKSGKQREWETS